MKGNEIATRFLNQISYLIFLKTVKFEKNYIKNSALFESA